jgi:tRNA-Thr(GGU) m(6)t(6)A37 methyltransferase TsaA
MTQAFTVHAIAIAHTPYHEKFGVPRQAGLVNVPAIIELLEPYNHADAVTELDQISHLWVSFIFSENTQADTHLKVRPPRLGGNKKIGVFATRSSFRPNNIGMSLVKLERIEHQQGRILLHVLGIDVLDGTPIIDIKPYLPYADVAKDAFNHLAPNAPELNKLNVQWQEQAEKKLHTLHAENSTNIQQWITEIVQLDPRPAYKTIESQQEYGMAVFAMNIRWRMLSETSAEIFFIEPFLRDAL